MSHSKVPILPADKNKFIFRRQNLLIFFKNLCKRKFCELIKFRGNFRIHTRKFIQIMFLDFVNSASCTCCKAIFLQ